MDHYHSTTGQHVKGKHLTFEERVIIQTRRKDGWSANRIAKELVCAPNTIRNEHRRDTVSLYHGKIRRYKASQGQKAYEQNRTNCCRHKVAKAETESLINVGLFHIGCSRVNIKLIYNRLFSVNTL